MCFALPANFFGATKNAFVDVFCNWKHPHRILEHEEPSPYVQYADTDAEDEWNWRNRLSKESKTSDAREYWRDVL